MLHVVIFVQAGAVSAAAYGPFPSTAEAKAWIERDLPTLRHEAQILELESIQPEATVDAKIELVKSGQQPGADAAVVPVPAADRGDRGVAGDSAVPEPRAEVGHGAAAATGSPVRKPTDWEVYADAHIAVCEKCRANGDRLGARCYKQVQGAWRDFQSKVKFIENSKRRRGDG